VCHDCDIVVAGGSTTGVFAAVAAARLGARVAVIEQLGMLGGTATASFVCVWHTLLDAAFSKPVIAGLVAETLSRLRRRNVLIERPPSPHLHFIFPPAELAIELDRMVAEAGIRVFLHARCAAAVKNDAGRAHAVIIEDKSGRRAITARAFVDATGDGDLVHQLGFETRTAAHLQPPTSCALVQGLDELGRQTQGFSLNKVVFDPKYPQALRPGFLWHARLPGADVHMVAGTRVHGADCSDAGQLTAAEIEGRRQIAAMIDLVRKNVLGGDQFALLALPARIGIRETRHAVCLHQLAEKEVLNGTRFTDAIGNGSYRVDVHSSNGDGLVFRYLDGREEYHTADGRHEERRWRPASEASPAFYQIPYRSLVPRGAENVLVAGRCIDADEGAFGAVRVMVNTGQMGHAAGVAAWLSLHSAEPVGAIDTAKLRGLLAQQGAFVL